MDMSIQKSIPDLMSTLDKLEAEHLDTYLEEWYNKDLDKIKTV
ncbi:12271_t:CDS:2 [Acaulospora colombiana]|uniref:12271_t:CDS:1 n=1 Tax=Acaulospora colombiana TaxID=27376 RepID=A0ACA9KC38_9GLOM|nr:12271_t:CDS:2 [Acaulospora colombiana]